MTDIVDISFATKQQATDDIAKALLRIMLPSDKSVILQQVKDRLDAVLLDIASNMAEASPHGTTGTLKGSWTQNISSEISGSEVAGFLTPTDTAPYAYWVIFGTDNFHTYNPGAHLTDWVMEVMGLGEVEAKRVAYAIGSNFMKNKMEGEDFTTPIFEANIKYWDSVIAGSINLFAGKIDKRKRDSKGRFIKGG